MRVEVRAKKPSLRLRITSAAETIVRGGHPWVFANSVREQNREGETGELALLFDRKDRFLAVGLFDAESAIRVRILHVGKPCPIDLHWWRKRAEEALGRRANLFDNETTGCRLINGESDGWPGLVLDRYGDTLALKIYTAAWLPRLGEIADLLANNQRVVLRLSRNIQKYAKEKFGLVEGQVLRGPALDGAVVFLENGLRFEADVLRGQKTGFFLDQRENRREAGKLAAGRTVLNLFSHTGGFSVYAASGGAVSVVSLDISEHALMGARRNFALNQNRPEVVRCRHEMVQADAFEWLRGEAKKSFDIVVVDPPSLAKREVERAEAIGAYGRLIKGAVDRLNKGGTLVAASCSAHVSAEEFFGVAREFAAGAEELKTTGHAADHPATFPEAQYLKCIYLRRRG
ncbi:MAG TPA: class I SAM-dependent methyltransferase [Verrucomicrobiae bacterium]|jgi:23S rRNA (cytosine1962-C5)-methyltransferase